MARLSLRLLCPSDLQQLQPGLDVLKPLGRLVDVGTRSYGIELGFSPAELLGQ
jgi:hypothetical protein